MNDKLVLKRARELCGEDRHEKVLRTAYKQKHGDDTEIDADVLARHINNLKTRGKVADYLREFVEQEAANNSRIATRMPRQRRGDTRIAA